MGIADGRLLEKLFVESSANCSDVESDRACSETIVGSLVGACIVENDFCKKLK